MTYTPQLNISRTHSEALLGDPYLPQSSVDVTADHGLELSDLRLGAGGVALTFWDQENRQGLRLSIEARGGRDWAPDIANAVSRYISEQGRRTYSATTRSEARAILERLDGDVKEALSALDRHEATAAAAAAAGA